MDVTIYTVSTCPFSKEEKDYLTGKKITFKEVLVEKTPENLKEFNTVSDGFAGVPLTIVKKEDNSVVKVKGFNQVELDKALGLTPVVTQEASPAGEAVKITDGTASVASPVNSTPIPVTPADKTQIPPIAQEANPTVAGVPELTILNDDMQTVPPSPDINSAPVADQVAEPAVDGTQRVTTS